MNENFHRAIEALCGMSEGFVTDLKPVRIAYDIRGVSIRTAPGAVTGLYPYIYRAHRDEAEAYEALASRGLVLEETPVRKFTCHCWGQQPGCPQCKATARARVPASLYQLLAWADLGPARVLAAEALTGEAVQQIRRDLGAELSVPTNFHWVFDVQTSGYSCWYNSDRTRRITSEGRVFMGFGADLAPPCVVRGLMDSWIAGTPVLTLESGFARLAFPQSESNRTRP